MRTCDPVVPADQFQSCNSLECTKRIRTTSVLLPKDRF